MNSLLHALNIGTLAAWLSVVGFGSVGVILPGKRLFPNPCHVDKLEVLKIAPDITIGDHSATTPPEKPSPAPPEALPGPPALPDIARTTPLPEVPELPQATSTSRAVRSVPQPASSKQSTAATSGKTATSGNLGNTKSASALSLRSRLAAGHMPAPEFPPYSRRNHQEGTVVVEFCVNPGGHVTAAIITTPCKWPLLNHTAVRAVMNWSFPPGDYITLERTITFKLN